MKVKANLYDEIKIISDIKAEFSEKTFSAGTIGIIIECYTQPKEGYSVDLAIPDPQSVTGYVYDNVILLPEQFMVLNKYQNPVGARK